MFDPGQMLGGSPSQSPEQMGGPSLQNPGGEPEPMKDPLAPIIDAVIVDLNNVVKAITMNNDPEFALEVKKFILRLDTRKLARKKTYDEANAARLAPQANMQF